MKEEISIVSLEDDEDIKCPHCGAIVVEMDEPYDISPCEHVRFVYNSLAGEFEFAEPGFEDAIKTQEEQDEDFDVWDALKKSSQPEGMILEQREFTLGGFNRTWVGIRHRPATG